MELTNDFRVAVPVAEAWQVLTDLERIAPCMPGAQLQEVEGEEYRGIVKVKVGPITAQYKGAAHFVEKDDAGHRAVLRAEGRDTRGQGNAAATITATLVPDGEGTAVSVVTDLTVTGKVATFGRGVLADVSAKLLDQFVECLETTVLAGDEPAPAPAAPDAAASPTSPTGAPEPAEPVSAGGSEDPVVATAPGPPLTGPATGGPRRVDSAEARPVDLVDAAGASVAKRVGPVVGLVALLWLVRQLLRRRRG
jgi:uncharacterized protein